jgi:Ca2+/Na+ antiporter
VMFFNWLPLSLIVLVVSFGVSCAIFFTSKNDCPPKYHWMFTGGSFVGCICVISMTAKEVVSIMRAFGIISGMSDSMVGLSILAWGNSVGDLFSNIALAKQGYSNMAFSACFGGPMFSKFLLWKFSSNINNKFSDSLLGVGITFVLKALYTSNEHALVSCFQIS